MSRTPETIQMGSQTVYIKNYVKANMRNAIGLDHDKEVNLFFKNLTKLVSGALSSSHLRKSS